MRAEQTGYWPDGDTPSAQPRFGPDHIHDLVRTIRDHNAAWSTWFGQQGVEPLSLTYEDVTRNPRQSARRILDHLGIEVPADWRPTPRQQRQADEINADWVRRHRAVDEASADTAM